MLTSTQRDVKYAKLNGTHADQLEQTQTHTKQHE